MRRTDTDTDTGTDTGTRLPAGPLTRLCLQPRDRPTALCQRNSLPRRLFRAYHSSSDESWCRSSALRSLFRQACETAMLSFKFARSSPPHDVRQHDSMPDDTRHTRLDTARGLHDFSRASTPSQPMKIPSRNSSRSSSSSRTLTSPTQTRSHSRRRRVTPPSHKQDALPAAVAALLAVTSIPPRKQSRKSSGQSRRISIDELVQEWRTDALASTSYGSHKTMEILLESSDTTPDSSIPEEYPTYLIPARSTSSESTPSLDADDDTSVSSSNTPPTPGSLRLCRASSVASGSRKMASRSFVATECCESDHPLIAATIVDLNGDDVRSISLRPTPAVAPSTLR